MTYLLGRRFWRSIGDASTAYPDGSQGALPYYKAIKISSVYVGDVTDFSVKKVVVTRCRIVKVFLWWLFCNVVFVFLKACIHSTISTTFGQYFVNTFCMYDLQQAITTMLLVSVIYTNVEFYTSLYIIYKSRIYSPFIRLGRLKMSRGRCHSRPSRHLYHRRSYRLLNLLYT